MVAGKVLMVEDKEEDLIENNYLKEKGVLLKNSTPLIFFEYSLNHLFSHLRSGP